MKLKVCGMNQNPIEVAQLHPDYLGFIFWEPSSRYFGGDMPTFPKSIKKVGVFVDASVEEVMVKVAHHHLDAVQLHGKESVEYCSNLRHAELVSASQKDGTPKQVRGDGLEIIKVFSIKDDFDFSILKNYESVCDYFLFDTKGRLPGGNGYTFDWSVLERYPSTKPFFLSGGIGLDSVDKLKAFLNSPASQYCFAIDVNSKLEIEPGLKDIPSLKTFINELTDDLQLKTDN
ncbi:phosphoribosylanthranilate isomerase [Flagellimonas taeanensis]|uniref:phosphoribosylanthranilate isomerase n=1 Tax=Flavobacteriaceae TaxID=49546 RepID=UPI000E686C44|nr:MULTISPECIES: phosphoribosylanthranilate isomerase [Allomuricauda]MDC6384408.1 phosphoribosylanthranilate isomerase [Muricauda sp. SK9]RIV49756.1 phosphoribosylanthranilate isomerase [Allomuricauda taeanensis]RIV53955.1 phosphoribosylanthranilate isomerase [Allomuricauda taeanensis]